MMNKKISIITVSYNMVTTIEETILSVINQSYSNIEYIIIDGGSVDGTVDIIKKYNDKIFYWVSEPDKGIYDAMNKALDLFSGNWVLFLGADDILLPIEAYISQFDDLNCLYYGFVLFKNANIKYGGEFTRYKLAISNICHQSIFYPEFILKKNKFELLYTTYADYYLNILIWGDSLIKKKYLNFCIVIFNEKGFSSLGRDKLFKKKYYHIIRTNLGTLPYLYSKMVHIYMCVKQCVLTLGESFRCAKVC